MSNLKVFFEILSLKHGFFERAIRNIRYGNVNAKFSLNFEYGKSVFPC